MPLQYFEFGGIGNSGITPDQDRVLRGKQKKIYQRYLMKLNNIPSKTKQQLYLQLADKINQFNEHSSRKLELFLGSKGDMKRNLTGQDSPANNYSAPTVNRSYSSAVQQPMMQQPVAQQPMMMQPMGQQAVIQNGQMPMNVNNGLMMNQAQPNGRRKLFIGQMLGGIGGGIGQAAGALTGGAKSVASGLGANGGAGAGLLGAGAGLMMATMGSEKEEMERDNLQQELRSKEFRFMLERGKKDAEMNTMDKHVRPAVWTGLIGRFGTWNRKPMTLTRKWQRKFTC